MRMNYFVEFSSERIFASIRRSGNNELLSEAHISREQYSDVDEHIASLPDWNMNVVQLAPGQCKTSQLVVSIRDYSYIFYSYKLRSLQTTKLTRPGVSFLIPLSSAPVSFFEQKFNSPVICCVPFGKSVSIITPDNFRGVAVTITNQVLCQGLDARSQVPDFWPEPIGNTFHRLTPPQLLELQTVLLEISRRFDSVDDIGVENLRWLKTFSKNRLMPLIFSAMASQSAYSRKFRPLIFRSALWVGFLKNSKNYFIRALVMFYGKIRSWLLRLPIVVT